MDCETQPSIVVSFTGCVRFPLFQTLSAFERGIAPVLPSAPSGFFFRLFPLSFVVVFYCFVLVLHWFFLFLMETVGFSVLPVFMRRIVILHGTTFLRMSQIAWIRLSLPSCVANSTPFSTAHLTSLAPTLLAPYGRVRWLSPTCLIPCTIQTSGVTFTPMLLRSPVPDGTAVFRPVSTWVACLYRGFLRWSRRQSARAHFAPLCRHRVSFHPRCQSRILPSFLAQHYGNLKLPFSRTRNTSISSPVFKVGGAWHRHTFHLYLNGGKRGNRKLRASSALNSVVNWRHPVAETGRYLSFWWTT